MQIPKFANEAEEAAWWDANREMVSEEFAKAAREGRLHRRSADGSLSPTPRAPILDEDDLIRAHEAAQRRGMTFEQYLRQVVQEALEREPAA